MRVDGIDRQQMYGADGGREPDATGWALCTVVLDVPLDAVAIFFGPMLTGAGQAWFDDLSRWMWWIRPKLQRTEGGKEPDFERDPKAPLNPKAFQPALQPQVENGTFPDGERRADSGTTRYTPTEKCFGTDNRR